MDHLVRSPKLIRLKKCEAKERIFTVEKGAIDGQEAGQVFTHADDLCGGINELRNCGNTIVRNVATG